MEGHGELEQRIQVLRLAGSETKTYRRANHIKYNYLMNLLVVPQHLCLELLKVPKALQS